jgi:hypothetical protein
LTYLSCFQQKLAKYAVSRVQVDRCTITGTSWELGSCPTTTGTFGITMKGNDGSSVSGEGSAIDIRFRSVDDQGNVVTPTDSKDANHHGGPVLKKDEVADTKIIDNNDGTYGVTFVCKSLGRYQVNVLVNGQPIGGSPKILQVLSRFPLPNPT